MKTSENKTPEHSIQSPEPELLQFDGGSMAFRYRQSGDAVDWGHKWAPGWLNPSSVAIVQTRSGERFVIRKATELVQLAKPRPHRVGRLFKAQHKYMDLTPAYEGSDGFLLPELILGQEWWPLNRDNDPVVEVMFEYKTYPEGHPHAVQACMPNPFEVPFDVRKHI